MNENTDKFYRVKITPMIEDNITLRVPEGAEINKEILKKSWYFKDFYEDAPPSLLRDCKLRFEYSEVPKEEWTPDYDPEVDKDGEIHFEYDI